jgi:DNA-binding IclR family transcriptional regulator
MQAADEAYTWSLSGNISASQRRRVTSIQQEVLARAAALTHYQFATELTRGNRMCAYHHGNGEVDARQNGRSVTSKVVAILDAFSAETPRLSLQGLAERTGLPQSTAYRLASELVEWGGLERGSGGYQIGLRLWELGELARRAEQLRDLAMPFMQDLYDATHENVHLAMLDGREALYIEKISGRRAARVVTRRGGRLPLHATGVGKALLAHAPEEFVSEILSGDLKRYTPHTIVAPAQLRQQLSRTRRTGSAFAIEEMSLGSVSVAAPILLGPGMAVAALAVVVRSSRTDIKRLAPAVRATANSLSRMVQQQGLELAPNPESIGRPHSELPLTGSLKTALPAHSRPTGVLSG